MAKIHECYTIDLRYNTKREVSSDSLLDLVLNLAKLVLRFVHFVGGSVFQSVGLNRGR